MYSGDSGCGGCTTINRGLLSLTLDFSEGAVTMIGDELLVSNGGDATMYADSSEGESGRELSLNSVNQELI